MRAHLGVKHEKQWHLACRVRWPKLAPRGALLHGDRPAVTGVTGCD